MTSIKAISVGFCALSALFVAAPASADVHTYSGSGFAINDLSTHSSTITVVDADLIDSITFQLTGMTHSFWNDLVGTVTHNGVTAELFNHEGGGRDAAGNYIFTIDAVRSIQTGIGNPISTADNYSFTYPGGGSFVGSSLAGDWTLTISDQVGVDSGNLEGWSLSAITGGAVPEPATWALMILGFGLVGGSMRRRSGVVAAKVSYS